MTLPRQIVHGKRKQGRPKLLYTEYIAKLINNEVQPKIEKLRKIEVERTEWSKFVVACKPRLFSADDDDFQQMLANLFIF